MNENTEKIIEQLSQKLGVASEKIWESLIRQAPIDATCAIVVMAALTFCIYKSVKWFIKKDWDEEPAQLLVGAGIAILTLITFFFYIHLPVILAGFFNKEYWAAHEILSAFKQ